MCTTLERSNWVLDLSHRHVITRVEEACADAQAGAITVITRGRLLIPRFSTWAFPTNANCLVLPPNPIFVAARSGVASQQGGWSE